MTGYCDGCGNTLCVCSAEALTLIDEAPYCPSVDVCGWCGDSECDGIACIASLDPDNPEDHDAIEQLHAWLRRGNLAEQMERALARAENRQWRGEWV